MKRFALFTGVVVLTSSTLFIQHSAAYDAAEIEILAKKYAKEYLKKDFNETKAAPNTQFYAKKVSLIVESGSPLVVELTGLQCLSELPFFTPAGQVKVSWRGIAPLRDCAEEELEQLLLCAGRYGTPERHCLGPLYSEVTEEGGEFAFDAAKIAEVFGLDREILSARKPPQLTFKDVWVDSGDAEFQGPTKTDKSGRTWSVEEHVLDKEGGFIATGSPPTAVCTNAIVSNGRTIFGAAPYSNLLSDIGSHKRWSDPDVLVRPVFQKLGPIKKITSSCIDEPFEVALEWWVPEDFSGKDHTKSLGTAVSFWEARRVQPYAEWDATASVGDSIFAGIDKRFPAGKLTELWEHWNGDIDALFSQHQDARFFPGFFYEALSSQFYALYNWNNVAFGFTWLKTGTNVPEVLLKNWAPEWVSKKADYESKKKRKNLLQELSSRGNAFSKRLTPKQAPPTEEELIQLFTTKLIRFDEWARAAANKKQRSHNREKAALEATNSVLDDVRDEIERSITIIPWSKDERRRLKKLGQLTQSGESLEIDWSGADSFLCELQAPILSVLYKLKSVQPHYFHSTSLLLSDLEHPLAPPVEIVGAGKVCSYIAPSKNRKVIKLSKDRPLGVNYVPYSVVQRVPGEGEALVQTKGWTFSAGSLRTLYGR
jgi:hypothetical protein